MGAKSYSSIRDWLREERARESSRKHTKFVASRAAWEDVALMGYHRVFLPRGRVVFSRKIGWG